MRFAIRFACALACIALQVHGPAHGAVHYVGAEDDAACEFSDVQSALNHAATVPGADVVRLVRTRAYPNQALVIDDTDDLDLVGGFNSCSDPEGTNALTLLDGGGGVVNPIVSVHGTGTVRLRALSLYGNNGSGLSVICACTVELSGMSIRHNEGAPAVFVGGASPLLRVGPNVGIAFNQAPACAGLHLANAVLDMRFANGSRISDNVAEQDGGGLCLYDAVGSISADVERNGAGRNGGGIAVFGNSVLQLFPTNASNPPRIASNTAGGRGGGLYVAPLGSGDHPSVTGWDTQFLSNRAHHGGAIHLANEVAGDTDASLCLRSINALPEAGGECPAGVPDGALACHPAYSGCNRLADNVAEYPDSDLGGLGAAVMSLGPRTRVHLSHARLYGNSGWSLLGHDDGLVPSTAARIRVDDSLLARNTLDAFVVFTRFIERITLQRTTLAGNDALPFRLHDFAAFDLHDSVVFEPGHETLVRSGSGGVESIDMVLASETASLNPSSSVVQTSDPGFVDPAANDWHLRPGSPAIDFSDHVAGIQDLDGKPRHVALPGAPDRFGPTDLGAYERQDEGDGIFDDGFEWSP